MSNKLIELPSYIVSEQILNQTDRFTINDIFEKVNDKLKNVLKNTEEILFLIKNKIVELCDLGLISGTESFYYVIL